MRINTNVAAMNSYNQLKSTQNNMSKSLERLSSGKRINRAADDAAGLAISEKMKGQMKGLAQAQRNAQDGISMIQTAEGALQETHSILQRMRELSVQAANDSNTNDDRAEIQKEVDQLSSELTRISNTTEFNTRSLLNGGIEDGKGGKVSFQIGANKGQNMDLSVGAMDAASLGVGGTGKVADVSSATDVTGATVARVGQGDQITTGQAINVSGVSDTAQTASFSGGTTGLTGLNITTTDNTSEANNYEFKVVSGSAGSSGVSASVDGDVITVTVDSGGASSGDVDAMISNLSDETGISFVGSGNITAYTIGSGNTADRGGVASGNVLLKASGTSSEFFTVGDDATAYEFDSNSDFAGLSLELDGSNDVNTGATVSIAEESASAATFDANGNKTADASAKFGINVSSQENANDAIEALDNAINKVSQERAKLGANQNRLEHTINNLSTAEENLTAANSRVRDVDMAKEMMNMSKQRILSQAGTAMLAQANQKPQGVLQLLG